MIRRFWFWLWHEHDWKIEEKLPLLTSSEQVKDRQIGWTILDCCKNTACGRFRLRNFRI